MIRRVTLLCAAAWLACGGTDSLAQSPLTVRQPRGVQRLDKPESLRLAALREQSSLIQADSSSAPVAHASGTPEPLARLASLRVNTLGPRELVVGKAAPYVVQVENTDTVAAGEIAVRLVLPQHVEVTIEGASSGQATQESRQDATRDGATLCWRIPRLLSHGREQLRLTVLATRTQPFAMRVTTELSAESAVEVLEPKLSVALAGRDEVVFGEDAQLLLTVHNCGTGPAEEITLELLPHAAGAEPIRVGTLAAGEEKCLEFAVPANVAGEHRLRAVAKGARGLEDEATHTLLVRQAELTVDISGPQAEYAGASLEYQIACHNTGNATAKHLRMQCTLPEGLRYTAGLENAEQQGQMLGWVVENLEPGEQRAFHFQCLAEGPGDKQLQLEAEGDAHVLPISPVTTEIRAVADLKLSIHDTPSPRAVGEDSEFEIRISNRGTEAAREVHVTARCAEAVRPVDVTGNAVIEDGAVFFQPVPVLEPGKTAVLKVSVRGTKSGSFPFRVEVECENPDTRLVAEETVRFFTRSRVSAAPGGSRRR